MAPMRECAGSIAHVPGSGSSVVSTVRVAVSAILEPPGLGTGLIPVLPLTTVAYTTIFQGVAPKRGEVARATVVSWGREPTKRRPPARGLEGLSERLPGPD